MEAYLDNAATTPVSQEVFEAMKDIFLNRYGNPASMHKIGYEAECIVKDAKKKIADVFRCEASEIIITSGGTESINTVIYGVLSKGKEKHIAASIIEHSAVYNAMLEAQNLGNKVSFVKVDTVGLLDMESLEETLNQPMDLFNLIWVNNEIGTVQKVDEIVKRIRLRQPKCLIHLDATQAIGKIRIDLSKLDIDFMSGSAHKLQGPKGVGLLFKRKRATLSPLLVGGGQQAGLRAGTENVPGTVGLSVALDEAYKDFDSKIEKMHTMKEKLVNELEILPGVKIHSPMDDCHSPHIVSLSVKGIRSEVLLHELADKGVYVSAGSACHSTSKNKGSRTLNAIGLSKEDMEGTVRLSLAPYLNMAEIDYAILRFKPAIEELGKYIRK